MMGNDFVPEGKQRLNWLHYSHFFSPSSFSFKQNAIFSFKQKNFPFDDQNQNVIIYEN